MKRLIRVLVLSLAMIFLARTTDGILVYTWYWISTPGQLNGGYWSLIAVDPYMGF